MQNKHAMERGNSCHDSVCAAWREDSALMPHDFDAFLAHFQNTSSGTEKMEKMANMSYQTMSGTTFYSSMMKRQRNARA